MTKTILVNGASRGIGRATAERGWSVGVKSLGGRCAAGQPSRLSPPPEAARSRTHPAVAEASHPAPGEGRDRHRQPVTEAAFANGAGQRPPQIAPGQYGRQRRRDGRARHRRQSPRLA